MGKQLLFISLILAVLASGCIENREKVYQQSLEEISKQELATALEERDRLLALFKEVTAALEDIRRLDDMVTAESTRPSRDSAQRIDIVRSIDLMKKRITMHQDQLQTLEKDLEISTINNRELHELTSQLQRQIDFQIRDIENLSLRLAAANEHIGMLTRSIDSLNATASSIAEQRDDAIETSIMLEDELNTCYYTVASKQELKENDIVSSGFLRKTRLLPSNFDRKNFIQGDKRTLRKLDMGSPKARILTDHPAAAYRIEEADGTRILHIIDTDEFWKTGNFIVIQKD